MDEPLYLKIYQSLKQDIENGVYKPGDQVPTEGGLADLFHVSKITSKRALNMLAEATTTELTNAQNPHGLEENRAVAKQGGKVAGNARKEIESQTGRSVVTSGNAQTMLLGNAVVGMIESVTEENEKE